MTFVLRTNVLAKLVCCKAKFQKQSEINVYIASAILIVL